MELNWQIPIIAVKKIAGYCCFITGIAHLSCSFYWSKKTISFFCQLLRRIVCTKDLGWVCHYGEKNLPALRKAVIACNGIPLTIRQELPEQSLQMVDYWYARDYEPFQDIKIIWKSYRRLGG